MLQPMLARLSPFFPALLVFVGALFVAAGGFWASWRQSNFNMELRAKNEEISRLQGENANAITGGDSFAYAGFQIFGMDGKAVNAHSMPDDLLLVPIFIHKGRYPLYDVNVRFADLDKPIDFNFAANTFRIGNMAPELGSYVGNPFAPSWQKYFLQHFLFGAKWIVDSVAQDALGRRRLGIGHEGYARFRGTLSRCLGQFPPSKRWGYRLGEEGCGAGGPVIPEKVRIFQNSMLLRQIRVQPRPRQKYQFLRLAGRGSHIAWACRRGYRSPPHWRNQPRPCGMRLVQRRSWTTLASGCRMRSIRAARRANASRFSSKYSCRS